MPYGEPIGPSSSQSWTTVRAGVPENHGRAVTAAVGWPAVEGADRGVARQSPCSTILRCLAEPGCQCRVEDCPA